MNPKEMTGLQLLQAMCNGRIPAPSMSETVSMQPYEVSEGTIHFKVKADNRHLNPLGGIHGGFAATVLDSVTGCAVHSMLEAGVGYGTIDLNIKMCHPTPQDQQLVATGTIINIHKTWRLLKVKL
jgi:uncharacterized protein (TIGR00369 family)